MILLKGCVIMSKVYKQVLKFKAKYPMTIGWRIGFNSSVIDMHLNPDEKVLYSFIAQKNDNPLNIVGFLSFCAFFSIQKPPPRRTMAFY